MSEPPLSWLTCYWRRGWRGRSRGGWGSRDPPRAGRLLLPLPNPHPFFAPKLWGEVRMKHLEVNVWWEVEREERGERGILVFFLLPRLQLHLVRRPVQDCKCKRLGENIIFLLIEQSFEVSPLSLFAFPTPALVALSLHPPPRKLELESKILPQESLNWNLRSSAKRAWIELESKSQLNECQSGLCWSSLQKPICLMSGFNTFVCCRRAN